MVNPSGPYPGRQLFVGLTREGRPCFAYLVTGRSPQSRQRKAIAIANTIQIGPLGDVPYDPLRHYNAVKYDDISGVVAVSNGIQTEAIYETYKLLLNVNAPAKEDILGNILESANAEPDSLHTPRIGGIIIPGDGNFYSAIGIKAHNTPAIAQKINLSPGSMTGVSTYKGDIDAPEATDTAAPFPEIEFEGTTAAEIAQYMHDMSFATYNGDDIRVCSVGGLYSGNKWEIAIVNNY